MPKKKPVKNEITYVLPVYNSQNTIADSVRSLLNQKIPGEIIIMDDGSTDNTPRILEYLKPDIESHNCNNMIMRNDKRKGAAACRNLCNHLVTTNIIAVCDADIYYKERSEKILEFFDDFPEMDVFFSALHLRSHENPNILYIQEAPLQYAFTQKCPISHPTVAYRTKAAVAYPYHERSIDTDLFEFMLIDMFRGGFKFGGHESPLMMKIEGDSKRDMTESKKLKQKAYDDYGIKVNL